MESATIGPVAKTVIPGRCIHASKETAPIAIPGSSPGPEREPVVELIREEGIVRAIDITCTCGQRIRLHCDYLG